MFDELRNMRKRLNYYYTLIFVLVIALTLSLVYFNVYVTHRITIDRELQVYALQVKSLHILPEVEPLMPPVKSGNHKQEKNADQVFKSILRDETMEITRASTANQELFTASRQAALQTWLDWEERWDVISLQGVEYRLFSIPFQNDQEKGVVQTYCSVKIINTFISKFTQLLIATGLIAASLAALSGWLLAGRAMIPVRQAWQRQKEFIADASHELKTPLTVIQSNLDVVLADQGDSLKENIPWLQNAYNETEHMGKLVKDMLFIAHIDDGALQPEMKKVNLSELLLQLASSFEPVFQKAGLQFSWTIAPEVMLVGDAALLKQMASIFLDNASKYTPAGGNISLQLESGKDAVDISVTDSGIGIETSEQEDIFHRFYRIDKSRSRKQGGTGLGLAIAAWIANEHQAQIQLSSEPGKGSTFKVRFPV